MKRVSWHLFTAVGFVMILSCGGEQADSEQADPGEEESRQLALIASEYSEKLAELSLYTKFRRGETITEIADQTPEASQAVSAFATELLGRLATIDSQVLEHEDWLTWELLRWDLSLMQEAKDHYWADFNVTPYAGGSLLNVAHQVIAAAKVDTPRAHDDYLTLVAEYGDLIHQFAAKLQGQVERGIYLPQPQVTNVRQMFEGYQSRLDELLLPDAQRLAAFRSDAPAGEGEAVKDMVDAFKERVNKSIVEHVSVGYEAVLEHLGPDYETAAPEDVGLGRVPGGSALYLFRVKQHSTTNYSPEEIHALGLEQVEMLEEEMAQVRRRLGSGSSMASFYEAIRSDRRFIAASAEALEEKYMNYVELIEPKIPEYFSMMPVAPYGVRRLDPTAEGSMTFGYYQPPAGDSSKGEYRYNGSDLENRSTLSAQGLIYHELVPGHHFQIALQHENLDLPNFRRENASFAAFTEGWAEYAANLGKEMGVYQDLYDLYGRLAMEMFVACRLVVDTGMNHLGWTLEEAREFMQPRVVYSDAELETELLRYSADIHGQALAYRIGTLEIARLREKAEAALGEEFDIREFHQAVIGSGAMPMTVLEKHIDWWIGQQSLGN